MHSNPFDTLHPPSAWVQRWTHLIPTASQVLDVACGPGRHMVWLASQGYAVTGVDQSAEALASAQAQATAAQTSASVDSVRTLQADIENGPWPFAGQQFAAVVVTNYLWRPLLPQLLASLAPGGVLIYETFASGNETIGKPSRPDFLLQTGELLRVCAALRVVAFEDGFEAEPARFVQRIAAIAAAVDAADGPARHHLRR
ncbi:class I SAM-dependent methyltransferase [Variovorax sp. HJSM1_2]|uniref:class I SAM-dependent methyltransferase n=1 Tax=Variovorax sp. HJSM1_2 TaxID=3366263 RepID=UPI003BDC4221